MPRNTSGLKRDAGPGRPKGSRNKVPRSFRASIRAIFEKIGKDDPELYEQAIRDGLRNRRGGSFAYVQLAAHYLDGKPEDVVRLNATVMPAPYVIVPPPGAVVPKSSEHDA